MADSMCSHCGDATEPHYFEGHDGVVCRECRERMEREVNEYFESPESIRVQQYPEVTG